MKGWQHLQLLRICPLSNMYHTPVGADVKFPAQATCTLYIQMRSFFNGSFFYRTDDYF